MTELNVRATGPRETKNALHRDPMLNGLRTRKPAEVFQWVEDNVNDIASAKELLKRLAVVAAYLLQEQDG